MKIKKTRPIRVSFDLRHGQERYLQWWRVLRGMNAIKIQHSCYEIVTELTVGEVREKFEHCIRPGDKLDITEIVL